MANQTNGQPAANPRCWACQTEMRPADRFCPSCGAEFIHDMAGLREAHKKKSRRNAAIMFSGSFAILLFAIVHHDWADIILIVAFGLPLFGVAALTWRMG